MYQYFDFDGEIEIVAQTESWYAGIGLLIRGHLKNGESIFAKKIDLEPIEPGSLVRPTVVLSNKDAQRLMDDLWHCGIRPTEGAGSAGSLLATENHLRDMQKIVRHLLKID